MNRFLLILALFCLFFEAEAFCLPLPVEDSAVIPAADPGKTTSNKAANSPISSSIPIGMQELMRASRLKYLEGSELIKAGDSDKAREAFDKAVDLLLQSNWDIMSTPALSQFFQDLIQRIQKDESRYLLAPYELKEEIESAAVDELNKVDLALMAADPALREALAADLQTAKYEIPIRFNEMVLKSLDFWMNRGRKFFVDGLMRSGQYRPIIEKVFQEESIPMDLMCLAQVESLFRPHAVSKAQAKGIWQFGKGTAIRYGLKVNRYVDERSDPEKSTRAAARYLNDLFAMFKDWNLVLAAYNWGEGKVKRLIDKTGMTDFWQLVDLNRRIPEETKKHIPLIQASVILAHNPGKYGFPTELDPPLQYAEVSISKPIDLRLAAKVLSTSLDELRKLNPALRGVTTPANYPNFRLKVPADSDPGIQAQVVALPAARIRPVPESNGRYKVRSGDTLSGIAARYHVSASMLEKANKLSPKKLVAGTWIQIPPSSAGSKRVAAPGRAGSPKIASRMPARKSSVGKTTTASKNQGSTRIAAKTVPAKATRPNAGNASLGGKPRTESAPKQIAAR